MRLVIADDDPSVRALLRSALARPDLEIVAEADDGAAALLAVVEHDPDLLITDLRMPYLDGVRLTEILSDARPGLVIYGFSGDEGRQGLTDAGAARIFEKPDPTPLVEAVEVLARTIAALRSHPGVTRR